MSERARPADGRGVEYKGAPLDAELLEIYLAEAAEVLETIRGNHEALEGNRGDRENYLAGTIVVDGTTVTLQPASTRQRRMLSFTPKSMATTW